MQYAISFNDRMDTYGVALKQDGSFIEGVCGIINSEAEKGAKFVQAVYVSNKPCILVFEKPDYVDVAPGKKEPSGNYHQSQSRRRLV